MYRVNFDTTIVTAFTGCPFYCKGYMSKMSYVTVYLYMVSCNTVWKECPFHCIYEKGVL